MNVAWQCVYNTQAGTVLRRYTFLRQQANPNTGKTEYVYLTEDFSRVDLEPFNQEERIFWRKIFYNGSYSETVDGALRVYLSYAEQAVLAIKRKHNL